MFTHLYWHFNSYKCINLKYNYYTLFQMQEPTFWNLHNICTCSFLHNHLHFCTHSALCFACLFNLHVAKNTECKVSVFHIKTIRLCASWLHLWLQTETTLTLQPTIQLLSGITCQHTLNLLPWLRYLLTLQLLSSPGSVCPHSHMGNPHKPGF